MTMGEREHKDPAARSSLWERPDPHVHPAPEVGGRYPAHLHKPGGKFLDVADADAEKAARAEEWVLAPVPDPAP